MAQAGNQDLTERFIQFYRNYYREAVGELAQRYPNEQRSLYIDYDDLYQFDRDLAEDFRSQPEQLREYAEEALRLYDLPADVSLGRAHVRIENLPDSIDIRGIRVHDDHIGTLVSVRGIVRKATDVRPKITDAAFECQRCGTMTYIPQSDGGFQEPHECQGCERQGPFRVNFDQSEFVDSQKLRIQESPEGLRGGETPQAIDVNVVDDITGKVTPGDHVTAVGVLHIEQVEQGNEKSAIFDLYMDGVSITVEDEQFEDMDITSEDVEEIIELSNDPDVYDRMTDSIAPAIYGYEEEKLSMVLQLFSGVTKHLPDGSRIRGDLHMLLIGDPGTGKSQMISYVENIAPRSVYTSGKGSSAAGLTAAAVRDDFGEGQQWSLEAGALVLADQGIAAIDELDKMRCVTGDALIHLGDGRTTRVREFAREVADDGAIEELPNGRTIRDVDATAWTMTDDGDLVRRPITAVHEYEAPDERTRVTLESGESVTATHDHPFFVFEDGERIERSAAELAEGDWVYVPRELPTAVSDGGTAVCSTSADPPANADGMSPAFAAVLGYLSGDGNVFYDRSQGRYGIRFTNTDAELLDDFEAACREVFDAEPVRHPSDRRERGPDRDPQETVYVHGKSAADAVLDAGMCLETYDGKSFPEDVSAGDRAAKAAFVRAMADSEGHVDTNAGNVRIASASYELLVGVKSLLLEFGVSAQIQTKPKEDGRVTVYYLTITDADSLESFGRHIGFTATRKDDALTTVRRAASGDRTILDVIPNCGDQLRRLRESLRLYQSECGINGTTYCNFENGDANVSIHRARRILDRFERRRRTAERDLDGLESDASWSALTGIKDRYHVSQRELAEGIKYPQQRVSTNWGDDEPLRLDIATRLATIVEEVAETDLDELRSLVNGDVKWRRVTDVTTVTEHGDDDRIEVLQQELAGLIGEEVSTAEDRARELCQRPFDAGTWAELRSELEAFGVSMASIARDIGVASSTVSRWFSGAVTTDRFDEVRESAADRIETRRREIRSVLTEIEERRRPKVYDLTVEGTHNFLANGMVVHNSEDRSAMHEGLEQQKISISKAGINATLKARCSLLGAANPKYGRFDQYEPIGEQIDLEPALISRFDLIFTVTDQPDPEHDSRLARHILKTNYAGELNTQREELTTSEFTQAEVDDVTEEVAPAIDADLLRKYIAYAKRNCYPTMTEDAKAVIEEFYVDLRSKGADEDAPVPVTARKLEALVRLAEASARVRLSDTVDRKDADRATDIVESCLKDIGVDPETGQFDADVVETGTSKSQRDRIKNLKTLIADIEEDYEEGAPVEEVIDRADEVGMDPSKAEDEIEKLRRKGEVYEPTQNHLRTT
ncbi:LAGLIDADG family homing endonuclease [Halopenitus persicus]|uniref:DNA helicase n=1 Tax=Halopenitus persicus TaxID=1048396 RepID=A0A1H3FRR4_9EURY|nr:LAGLIDADG family homing endonuclease [Halopenitus persicus]SDX93696.1 replicative DNA helicase Mcm [Halopenitus persicus]